MEGDLQGAVEGGGVLGVVGRRAGAGRVEGYFKGGGLLEETGEGLGGGVGIAELGGLEAVGCGGAGGGRERGGGEGDRGDETAAEGAEGG